MTTQPNPWDDPELAVNDDFVEFKAVGDKVSGTVKRVGKHTWPDGKVSPQILLATDGGDEKTVTAGQIRLKAELAEKRPLVGDHLSIELVNIEARSGGKTLKLFDVEVTRQGSTPVAATAPAVAQPAAAAAVDAAAALAALTPEQRQQLGLPPA